MRRLLTTVLAIATLALASPTDAQGCGYVLKASRCYDTVAGISDLPGYGPKIEPQQVCQSISVSSQFGKTLYFYITFYQGKDDLLENKKCSGRWVQLIGSLTGPGPMQIGPYLVPIEYDAYTQYTLEHPHLVPPFQSWQSFSGNSVPQLQLDWSLSGLPASAKVALVGKTFYFCLMTYASDGDIKSFSQTIGIPIVA